VEVIRSASGFREACDATRSAGRPVGFVATMGALHAGHRSLLARARSEVGGDGLVAMSVFVNPLQFDSEADLEAYPRTLEEDLRTAESAGCDLAFVPDRSEMYPNGPPAITIDPGPLGERWEGASRPGHFHGVLTVVAKLFHLVGPCHACFGQKDAQQLALIRRMVADLDMPVTVVPCPTIRDADGLALSSRNTRLTPEQRSAAGSLIRALAIAARLAGTGERRADVLRAEMARRIGSEPLASLDYVAVVDEATFEDAQEIGGPAIALVAARFGGTRLIDNLPLVWDGGEPAR
jgi:pantoate--beta-alanine ligase